jgi:hypothetical protein
MACLAAYCCPQSGTRQKNWGFRPNFVLDMLNPLISNPARLAKLRGRIGSTAPVLGLHHLRTAESMSFAKLSSSFDAKSDIAQ